MSVCVPVGFQHLMVAAIWQPLPHAQSDRIGPTVQRGAVDDSSSRQSQQQQQQHRSQVATRAKRTQRCAGQEARERGVAKSKWRTYGQQQQQQQQRQPARLEQRACHTQFKYVKLVQIVISTANDERRTSVDEVATKKKHERAAAAIAIATGNNSGSHNNNNR